MKAKSYTLTAKKGIVLVFECQRCGEHSRNKSAYLDPLEADDYQKILQLSGISKLP